MRSAIHKGLMTLRSGTSGFTGKCKAFAADRGGNFAMIFGLTSFALVMTAGMALDYSRLSSAKAQLNHAVDAAVLSTTRQITSGLINEEDGEDRVRDFIFANMDENNTGVPVSVDQVVIDQNAKTLEVVASLDVPMTLTKITGVNVRRVATRSKAQFSNTQIEVAMAIDITGSMNWDINGNEIPLWSSTPSRLDNLKVAAKAGIEEMFKAGNASDRLRVGLIPYSESVDASAVIDEINVTNSSDGCVYERQGSQLFTDAFASPGHPVSGTLDTDPQWNNGITNCPLAQLLPMTNDKGDLKDRIDALAGRGGTAGHLAVAWSYYMLSPDWNDAWPDDSKVDAYGSGTKKFAIIMTDGEFNRHDATSFDSDLAKPVSELYARSTCTEMKADGIQIYTIAFATTSQDAVSLMSDCATPDTASSTYFFVASDAAQLTAAFKSIAEDITSLRLLN